jgi:hypothetical protein
MADVTFGQLPEEEAEFLAYVRKTGDIWARAVRDDAVSPKYKPKPVSEFLQDHAAEIRAYSSVDVYLGLHDDVLNPAITIQEIIEGGTKVPVVENGNIVEGHYTIVGGTKVKREFIDPGGSRLLRYKRGEFRSVDELAASNLGVRPGASKGGTWIAHSTSFLKWGKKILDWMRRHTPESVPVYQCNYEMRATIGVAEACKKGLKLR